MRLQAGGRRKQTPQKGGGKSRREQEEQEVKLASTRPKPVKPWLSSGGEKGNRGDIYEEIRVGEGGVVASIMWKNPGRSPQIRVSLPPTFSKR